ncbi:hypothetical protein Scep_022126 [Stephania cephalantha]|uniref:Uncharacterized protein n=1 Tax=Stephania cephalantha TaxID=152367 RepID=A0AAP0I0R2_9MAGN
MVAKRRLWEARLVGEAATRSGTRGRRRPLVAGDSGGRHNWCEERRWERRDWWEAAIGGERRQLRGAAAVGGTTERRAVGGSTERGD